MMRELTRAEEEIMQLLWKLEAAFVKEIISKMPDPQPAYNTVSTIIRILEQKKMVSHKAFGKAHQYYPLISKEEYSKYKMNNLMAGYFNGSLSHLVSFFVKDYRLSSKDLDDILKLIEKEKQKKE